MKVEKSQQEVWEWKEKVYEEVEGRSPSQIIELFRKESEDFQKKYNLELKTYRPLAKSELLPA